jgi:hypothetical protein
MPSLEKNTIIILGDAWGKAKGQDDFRLTDCAKLKKEDITSSVRLTQALENENEPTWKEVKQMKDILGESHQFDFKPLKTVVSKGPSGTSHGIFHGT